LDNPSAAIVQEGKTMRISESRLARLVYKILWLIAALALVFYAWMMFDLVAHPLDAGANPILLPFLFRWLSGFCGTVTVVVALFILRRMPGNFIGLLLLLFGVGATSWSVRLDMGSASANNAALVVQTVYFFLIAFSTLPALLFHFPSGRVFPGHFTGWAWLLVLCQSVAATLAIMGVPAFQDGGVSNLFYLPALFPFAGLFNFVMVLVAIPAAIVSLVLRYRAGGERERLQIKWLVWMSALAIAISLFTSILFPDAGVPGQPNFLSQLLKVLTFLYWQIFPAVAIGIAILRYRLWDIDVIIRRTLIYTTLTAVLGLVYLGIVTLLQALFTSASGQSSSLSVVLSTLVIAAIFNPLRMRIQNLVDRRFYRQKYNAELALSVFAAAARQETNLVELTRQVVGVVEQTVQPEQISLWLRPASFSTRDRKE
jgi:hypothetical protein